MTCGDINQCSFQWLWLWRGPCVSDMCVTYRTYRVLCGYVTSPFITPHGQLSAEGGDGSSRLGPRGRIRLPLSCVWHWRWVSVSLVTRTSEDPLAQSGQGGCLYLAASQVHALSVIGSLSLSACVGSVFSTTSLPGRVGGECVFVCEGGEGQKRRRVSVFSSFFRWSCQGRSRVSSPFMFSHLMTTLLIISSLMSKLKQ